MTCAVRNPINPGAAMRLRPSLLLATLLPLGVAACGAASGPNYRAVGEDEYMTDQNRGGQQGKLFGDQGLVFGIGGKTGHDAGAGGEGGGGALGVNAYLWRGALDTLAFMPLASADPFGGVIITDWYQPPASPGERFKATAYILGRQLRADGVKITVFRQVDDHGTWVDAPVSKTTSSEIEDKVLARARELRSMTAQR
jgi:hypothetical protein